MKQRKFKFSLGMKIASILSCIALVSVGFASWWIVKLPTETKVEDGSFVAYTVVDKEILVSKPVFTDSISNIVFGKPTTQGTTRWLSYDDKTVQTESLQATMSFTVSVKNDTTTPLNTFVNKIAIEFDPQTTITQDEETIDVFDTAIKNGSIAAPVIEYKVGDGEWTSAGTYSSDKLAFEIDAPDTNTANVEIRFTFKWGSDCGGENPYTYFNGKDAEGNLRTYEDHADTARSVLSDIAKLAGKKYFVTINCTAK